MLDAFHWSKVTVSKFTIRLHKQKTFQINSDFENFNTFLIIFKYLFIQSIKHIKLFLSNHVTLNKLHKLKQEYILF